MNLRPDSLLKNGEYRICKILGSGGFGITYLAEQVSLERMVAIKEFFMKEHCNRDAETSQMSVGSSGSVELVGRFRQKFIKEARSIAKLKHRHIISVIDVFEDNNTAYYVMEYVGGGSLSDKVKEDALPEDVALRYIRQVAAALDFVHGKNMMHLDIKPSNILLGDNDETVLIDFGLAKQYDAAGSQTSTTPVGISHGYAPLEQYKRGGVGSFSPATDIYSLGATLYKLLTGETPPEAGDVNDDGLPALPQHISAPARAAIEAAMQPRRKDRPQSVGEFLALLECHSEQSEKPLSNDGATVIAGTSTLAGEASGGYVISSESEKSLENSDNEILRSAQNDKERVEEGNSRRNDRPQSVGEFLTPLECHSEQSEESPSNDGTTVIAGTFPPVIPNVCEESYPVDAATALAGNATDNEILRSAQNDKERPDNTPKPPFNKNLITIISAVAICIIAAIFGIKSCNDRKVAEAETQRTNAIAEQQRLDAEREAKEKADSIAAEQQRIEDFKRGIVNGHKFVDLGLPSGLLWATCNVGASKPEEYGGYYAWGETEEKEDYSWSTYKWCNGSDDTMTKYCTDSSYGTVDNKTVLDPQDDVAHVKWGGSWRLPTKKEFQELIYNCTWTWTTQNGYDGYKVTSKKNGNCIFLPAAGWRSGTSLHYQGSYGSFWSATPDEKYTNCADDLSFYDGDHAVWSTFRYDGQSVRPVCTLGGESQMGTEYATEQQRLAKEAAEKAEQERIAAERKAKEEAEHKAKEEAERKRKEEAERKAKEEAERKRKEDAERLAAEKKRKEEEERKRKEAEYARTHGKINGHEYVDLGLSVKWATCNVGASTPVGYGGNYAWGETKEKDDYYWSNYKWYNCSDGTMTKYCRVDYKTVLDPNDDVAHVKWGGSWRMPTKAEQDELLAKCTWTETTQNGVKGYKVTSKKNGNSIFLPAVPSASYWSISLYDDDTEQAYFLSCDGCNGWGSRCIGFAVRPVSE